jgi:hypothetical protein
MASKNLTEQTQNSLDFIKKGLNNAQGWVVNNAVDNTRVANNNYIYSSIPLTVSQQNEFLSNYKSVLSKIINKKGLRILIEAQSHIEGFKPFSRAYRNNNPGNLAYSSLLKTKYNADIESSTIKGEQRFAYFPTLETGVLAKADYIERIVKGEHVKYPKDPTLGEYIYIYAPPKENNTEGYIKVIVDSFAKNGIIISKNTHLSKIIFIS